MHLARREEQVVAPGIQRQEAKAVGMADDSPGNEIELGGKAQFAAPVGDDLAALDQSLHSCIERGALRALDGEPFAQFDRRKWHAGLHQFVEDLLVGAAVGRSVGGVRAF